MSSFDGLFDNTFANMLGGRASSRFNEVEDPTVEATIDSVVEPGVPVEEVKKLENEMQAMRIKIAALEELQSMSEQALLEADWGVNAELLRSACLSSFEALCPESVPVAFYSGIHRFPPPGPHAGLAPEDKDAGCWMRCVKEHGGELPFECTVAATNMAAWVEAHGEDQYLGDPQMAFLGALLHFLVMVLLLSACMRCTCLFIKLRRRRVAERLQLSANPKVVEAITIQIPAFTDTDRCVVEATVVTGTEVAAKK